MTGLNKIQLIDTLKREKIFLQNNFKVKEIGIFGSFVRDEQIDSSDIDILVDFSEPIGWDVVDLKFFLEKIFDHKVDLVLKEGISRNQRLWQSVKDELLYV